MPSSWAVAARSMRLPGTDRAYAFTSGAVDAVDAGGTLICLLGRLFSSRPPHRQRPFKAAVNVVVAEELALRRPWAPTGRTSLQKRSYAHLGLADPASDNRPGVGSPAYPPPPSGPVSGAPMVRQMQEPKASARPWVVRTSPSSSVRLGVEKGGSWKVGATCALSRRDII